MPTFRDDLHLGHSVPMVDTEDIVDGAITEPKLADDSVSTRTIQDGAVTEPKIAEKAVTEPKLADAAVSTRTVKFRAVTESKIGDSAVSTRTIQNGAVTNPKIANGAVSMNKLDNETQTLIQRGADSSWTPMGDYDVDALYYANDLVFDPETNSSYLSLRADNMGHAVTDETWWMKVLDGSYVNRAIEEMEAAIAQAIEDAQEDIDDAIAGANTAAQSANTAAQAATTAKNTLVEEISQSLAVYETVADTIVTDPETATGMLPVQNYVLGRAIEPLNNTADYVKGDIKPLAVGQAYALDEAVKTADGKILRMTKDIIGFTTSAVFNINDLVYYLGSTYQSLISVQAYDSTQTYVEGDYAVGRPAVVTITVDTTGLAADGNINVSIAGVEHVIAVTTTSTASEIAADIVEAVGSIEGWTITDNEDGTITVKCDSAGANTLAFSFADVDSTGVDVRAATVAGATTISVYDGSSWADADRTAMVDDESLFTQVDADWLATNAAIQNNVKKDIFEASAYTEELFDLSVATVGTSNTTYIEATKVTNGANWKIKAVSSTSRQGWIKIPTLSVGKKYRIRFDYVNTLPNNATVSVDKANTASATALVVYCNPMYIYANTSGTYCCDVVLTSEAATYICFRFAQGTKNKYLNITNISIECYRDIHDALDGLEQTNIEQQKDSSYITTSVKVLELGREYYHYQPVNVDNKIFQMKKDIKCLTLAQEIAVGDLYCCSKNTYIALKAISNYDEAYEYASGDYALNTPAGAKIAQYDGEEWALSTKAQLIGDTTLFSAITLDDLKALASFVNSSTKDGESIKDLIRYEEEISISSMTTRTQVIDATTGNWGNSVSGTSQHKLLRVYPGEEYVLESADVTMQYTFLLDNYNERQQKPHYSEDWIDRVLGVGPDDKYVVKVPSDAVYMYMRYHTSASGYFIPKKISRVRYIKSVLEERETPEYLYKNEYLWQTHRMNKLLDSYVYGNTGAGNAFIHCSDSHGDPDNLRRIMDFAKQNPNIQFVLHTGDIVYKNSGHPDNIDVSGAEKMHFCIGNHDHRGTIGPLLTPAQKFAKFLRHIDEWNVNYTPDVCYYYKDIGTTVRWIVLDGNETYTEGNTVYWEAAQLEWFQNILEDSRVNGKHVYVAMHGPIGNMSWIYSGFNELGRDDAAAFGVKTATYFDVNVRRQMADAVQAYIDAGGIFISWLCGHTHYSRAGWLVDYPDQFQIVAPCAGAFYNIGGSTGEACGGTRHANLINRDEFNVVAYRVDSNHNNKRYLYLMRFGKTYTTFLQEADNLIINLTDKVVVSG